MTDHADRISKLRTRVQKRRQLQLDEKPLCKHEWVDTYDFGGHYLDGSRCVKCGADGPRRF